jgi:hypothetical protein
MYFSGNEKFMVKNNGNIETTIEVMDLDKLRKELVERLPVLGDELTEEQLRLLNEARVAVARGEYSTNEEVMCEIDEWFKKG